MKDFSIFVIKQIHREEANLCKVKEHYWILHILQSLTPEGGTLVHNSITMDYWYQTSGDTSWLTLMHRAQIPRSTFRLFV